MSGEDLLKEHIVDGHSDVVVAAAGVGAVLGETAHHVHHTDTVGAHALVSYAPDIA